MNLIDLTHTVTEDIPVYPGKTPYTHIRRANYEHGSRVEDINMSGATGTHIDASAHFTPGGPTIEAIPLDRCHGPAAVLHLHKSVGDNPNYAVTVDDIHQWEQEHETIPPGAIVLVYTGWSRFWNSDRYAGVDSEGIPHHPHLDGAVAQLFVERRVSIVGIDTLSPDAGTPGVRPIHKTLLPKEVFIVENVANLDQLPPTGAEAWMVPIKVGDVPEAPIRAFAIL